MTELAAYPYDFNGVPRKELPACMLYEYARESRAARREIAADRRQHQQTDGRTRTVKFGPRVKTLVQSHFLLALSSCGDFPDTPWQRLSDGNREGLLKCLTVMPRLQRYVATHDKPPLTMAVNQPSTMTLDEWKQNYRKRHRGASDSDPITFGFFAVNLKYGHAVLIDEFQGKLRTLEGKPLLEWPPVAQLAGKGKPGRKSFEQDSLNALGAMRLRCFCKTFAEAQTRMTRDGLWYGARSSFNVACVRALTRFTELFGWLDNQEPIHFTRGWKRG